MPPSPGESIRSFSHWWAAFGLVMGLSGRAAADTESCAQAHEQAQLARLHGQLVSARAALVTCAQTSCPALVRDDCSPWLVEVERALPSIVFAVDDGQGHDVIDVRIRSSDTLIAERADGRALALDPGKHTLRFEAVGFAPETAVISMREGEKQRLVRVRLKPLGSAPTASAAGPVALQPRARRLFRASYALAGIGVAGLSVGLGLTLRRNTMNAHCGRDPSELEGSTCSIPYHDRGVRMELGLGIAYAVGGLSLGTAAWTLWRAFRHKRGAATATQPPVNVSAGWNGSGMSFALGGTL